MDVHIADLCEAHFFEDEFQGGGVVAKLLLSLAQSEVDRGVDFAEDLEDLVAGEQLVLVLLDHEVEDPDAEVEVEVVRDAVVQMAEQGLDVAEV